ncbi:aspartic proteinase 39 isoform X3 [Manihot esculenta]|uniref:aspartic proteinase 39 isoform X3 n=1 Tax=Manihot esculenta TaxID=3983 RepID=UPI000B5D8A69|nr:aspartic proteinase 39 isoform X3 [Manihot esculenta]
MDEMKNLSTLLLLIFVSGVSASHGVFSVKYRYAGRERSLSDLKAHDDRRQLRILAGVDLPLGGGGRPDGVGLYYAKIGIGTPSKDYYVQVDTGSDIMWVNCIQCIECPRTSSLGMDLTLYNVQDSVTGKLVPCDQEFCYEVNGGPLSGCTANMSCPYLEIYGDGSSTAGYFVKDIVQYDRVSGDLRTTSANGSVTFGPHYNVNMTAVQVGHDFLDLPIEVFEAGDWKGAIIDSGTTLAYLPEMVYEPLVSKIISQQSDLKVHTVRDEYTCFQYSGSVDDGFPNVTFHFENSVFLKVYPQEYLFPFEGLWCIGWQNSGMLSRDKRNMTLLGDLVLSNKLVLYDLEHQAIGWTEYNCSSSIKVQDEQTGTVHLIGSHSIYSASSLNAQWCITLLLLSTLLHRLVY